MTKEPSSGIKILIGSLYLIGIILQAVIIYSYLSTDIDLIAATIKNDVTTVKEAIIQGVDLNVRDNFGKTPLIYAAEKGNEEITKLLIAARPKVNIDEQSNDGKTALIYAAEKGNTKVAKLLIEAGAKLDIKSNDGKTALIYATENGHTDIVNLLKEAGAKTQNVKL